MCSEDDGFPCDFCGSSKRTRTFVFEVFTAEPDNQGRFDTGFKHRVLNICPSCQSLVYQKGVEPLIPPKICDKCKKASRFISETTIGGKSYRLCPGCQSDLKDIIESE